MITVVVGPPCAGKSTYCEENSAPGDVVVDFDKLAVALGSDVNHQAPKTIADVAFAARDAVIEKLLSDFDGTAWVIHTSPTADQVGRYADAGAKFTLLDPGVDVCLERAGDRPEGTADTIRAWYESPPDLPTITDEASEKSGAFPLPARRALMKTKTVDVRFKAGPEDGLAEGEFLVYPSTFTKTPDAYGDIVAPGAFLDQIKEWVESGVEVPALYGHRMDDPDYFVGGALGADMAEDEHGWLVKGKFDLDSPKGPQVYRLVKGRRLNQLSFAYDVLEEATVELEDGTKANELRKLKVYEFSFVPIGANQDTSVVAVKALAEQIASDVKAGRAISAKNETTLREAVEKLSGATQDIKNVLSAIGEADDQEKASGHTEAKDEEPTGVEIATAFVSISPAKSEEPRVNPSAQALAQIQFTEAL